MDSTDDTGGAPTTIAFADVNNLCGRLGQIVPKDAALVGLMWQEIERLRRIEAAARVQWEAFGAYPGLVEALK